jgi:hypothetical protein
MRKVCFPWYILSELKEGVENMVYALHHMIPIIVAAVIMAAVGLLTVVFANKSQKINEEHGYDPAWDKSQYMCAGCKFFSACAGHSTMMRPEDEEDFKHLKEYEKQKGRVIPFTEKAGTSADAAAAIKRFNELKNTH